MVGRWLSGLLIAGFAGVVIANEPDFGAPQQHFQQQQQQPLHNEHTQPQQAIYRPPTPTPSALSVCGASPCDSFGCAGPKTTVVPVTTVVGPQPTPPNGFTGPSSIGPNGQTSWTKTHPSTLVIPTTSPTPACATWTIATVTNTIIAGTQTVVIKSPVITAVLPGGGAISTVTVTQGTAVPATTTVTTTAVVPTYLTSYVTAASATITVTSVSTFVLPPITHTVTSTSISTVNIGGGHGGSTTTAHVTVTTTTTVTSQPITSRPITSEHPITSNKPITSVTPPVHSCHAGVIHNWKPYNLYFNKPLHLTSDDEHEVALRVLDAGYKTEVYTVYIDGHLVGETKHAGPDKSIWCGEDVEAVPTCIEMGLGEGTFKILPGKHSIEIHNKKGFFDGPDYSSMFYRFERSCPGQKPPPAPHCTESLVHNWYHIQVQHSSHTYTLPSTNYDYPVKFTFVDGGFRTDRYILYVDNHRVGMTRSYDNDWNVYCGEDVSRVQECINKGFSVGSFVVPKGSHHLYVLVQTTANPAWQPYSTVYYKIEKYCGEVD